MMEKTNQRKGVLMAAIFAAISALLLWGWFFDAKPLGLNVPVVVILFYAAVLFLSRGMNISLTRGQNWIFLILNGAFCATFALYNNSLLLFLNTLAIMVLTALQVCLMFDLCTYYDFKNLVYDVFHAIFIRPFSHIGLTYREAFSSKKGEQRRIFPSILLGLAIALPVLVVLGLLLSSADAVFSKMLSNLFSSFSIGNILLYILLFAAVFTFSGSFLSSLADQSRRKSSAAVQSASSTSRNLVPFYVILISMSAILAVFSVIQLLYLFGGCSLPDGVTYAQYARSGFFQLFIAAVLVFSAVAFVIKLLPQRNVPIKILLSIMTFGILIMLASTFMRLVMYENEFMFTRLRLYVQAFTIMLFVITVLVTVLIWRSKFSLGKPIFSVAIIFLLALSYFNIDGFIGMKNSAAFPESTINLNDSSQRKALDYLLSISEDAAPYYISKIDPDDLLIEHYRGDGGYYSEEGQSSELLHTKTSAVRKVYHISNNGSALSDPRYWNLNRANAAAYISENAASNAAKTYSDLDLWAGEGLLSWYFGY